MFKGTKRPFLAFESDDCVGGKILETITPDVKRFAGLTTPPASPEKKPCKRPLGVLSSSLTNINEEKSSVTTELKPKRLMFGSDPTISKAKSLLQQSSDLNSDQTWLATRKHQYDDIMEFLCNSVSDRESAENSLYVTGPPGTGKTAQLDLILRDKFQEILLGVKNQAIPKHDPELLNSYFFESKPNRYQSVAVAKVNCIALARPEHIFQKIVSELVDVRNTQQSNRACDSIKSLKSFCMSKPNTHFVFILDEMDKLIKQTTVFSSATKIILELFLLAKEPGINVTVIGIANSIDLKDRVLNRLNLQKELLPKVIHFHPYNSEQMFDIVKCRLSAFPGCFEMFQPMAIKFATTKCSGSTGDLRRLFDLLRSSIQLVELESMNGSSYENRKSKVTITHVAKAVSKFMSSATTKTRIGPLNIQQKIILCSLVHREKSDLNQCLCTVEQSYDYYVKLLKKTDVMKPLSKAEFFESCNSLQSCGVVLIEFTKKKLLPSGVAKTIKSTVIETELQEEISKIDLLKRLL
ncbi:unnamed protein product [Kluyveromyces dobzhanskii CBS 2104]|uniref:Cell division control protein n=1 Tax=Kluyveromyces dobzhanskii CBS 2104 TaxID=1427455 RepID=A0A0A8L3Q5_9SACH|nr:unnamed protein product [Kluyveromyces dobzhanskii CBS 2104]